MVDIVPNVGLLFVANRILGVSENEFNTTNGNFNVSNGTATPVAADVIGDFTGDGDVFSKTITSASYSEVTKTITTICYISSVEANTLGTITKLALDNDNGSGKIIQEHKFTAIPKNDSKELFFTVKLTLADDS